MQIDVGDIVKINEDSRMYIVSDIVDFSRVINGKYTEDIDLELMQILPVKQQTFRLTIKKEKVDLQAKRGTKESQDILLFIKKERELKGWYSTPDFVYHVSNSVKYDEYRKNQKGLTSKSKKQLIDDIVRYDKLEDIDICLDALNDLDILYKMFGDESYLQLVEVIHKRIKELTKSKK